ncbi:MAG: glutamate-5-semialdehyde dehydrogenase [Kiritimatiellae bacterium]|nr:glutamate-5-semialdehyde dehydrogenase [Kiritimatiellia bacterium]
MDAEQTAKAARAASAGAALAGTGQKNAALRLMAERLAANRTAVLDANAADLAAAKEAGQPPHLIERLRFGEKKIESRIRCLRKIEALPDPVGQVFRSDRRPNGLEATRVRVPLGVILMIYEARPHVTVNAGAFCLKSGNAAILRGGSEARQCNALLGALWREALRENGLCEDAIQVVSGSHEEVDRLLRQAAYIDLVIPRGGKGLIQAVKDKSAIPVIKHFEGVCHVYVDDGADISTAIRIAIDSKCLMPAVCNAMETLLVAESMADHLPAIVEAFRAHGVAVRGCEATRAAVPGVEPATEDDWRTEYLDMIVSVRVVADAGAAIAHINTYGSHHTESIVTDSESRARRFVREVDSAVVLVNGSTMFCDGESLGMGAEIGISTDKLHARGLMGLEELMSYKHVVWGSGQVMGEWGA